jgi:hypothetical protein
VRDRDMVSSYGNQETALPRVFDAQGA